MTCKIVLSLMMLSLLTACTPRALRPVADTDGMPYGEWDFAFFTPHALPASVTAVMIIDTEDVASWYRRLDGVHPNPRSLGSWDHYVRRHTLFNKAPRPPAAMLFCWDSIIDKKTYETRIVFDPSLRDIMLTPTGKDSYGDTAWYDTLLFGLAPEGKVRIWLQNSAGGKNVPLVPKKITTLSGDKLDICKGVTQHPNGYVYYGDTPDFIKGKTYPYGIW